MSQSTTFGTPLATQPVELLLSDEPTIELIIKARKGREDAVEAIMQRCLPRLKRWAHGRLPAMARGRLDTGDLVQDAVMHALGHIHTFESRHVGAMQAYLRQSVINNIRDEVRRIGRQPATTELPEDLRSTGPSPIEAAIEAETYERYRHALGRLRPRDRQIVIARVELQWTLSEMMERLGIQTVDAARMSVSRALHRLAKQMH